MIDRDHLAKALVEHLPRQRWFASDRDVADVSVASLDMLRPRLAQVLADVRFAGRDAARYQLVCGVRSDGRPPVDAQFVVGEVDTHEGPAFVYDALADPELALELLAHVAPGERAREARLLGVEQSNSSVVYDERLIMKVFRRIPPGPNPDTEVTRALAAVGFAGVLAPVAEWRSGHEDYGVVARFLSGGREGWELALASVPEGQESEFPSWHLGVLTAHLHLALCEAFGREAPEPAAWAADMELQLERVSHPSLDREAIRSVYRRLAALDDAGAAIRIHGDLHLGQLMQAEGRWYVLDFEGEPARPLEERRRPSSPLRDVAGMLRSFDYAEAVGGGDDFWAEAQRGQFVEGYEWDTGIRTLLPQDSHDRHLVRHAFELDKAVYEVGYELAHRPEWVRIPLDAVNRILERFS